MVLVALLETKDWMPDEPATAQLLAQGDSEMAGDETLTERERILRLEARLDGLVEILREQRASDKDSLTKLVQHVSSQVVIHSARLDVLATSAALEQVQLRVDGIEKSTQLRLEGISGRQETMAQGILRLDNQLSKLADELSFEEKTKQDEAVQQRVEDQKKTSNRNLALVGIASLAAVSSVVVSIVFGGTNHTVIVQQPTTTISVPAR